MPFPRQYVDALLVNWGDRLFHDPLRHVRAPHLPGVALPRDARRLRERLALTLRRAPEVMVKITNKASGAQGMGAVRRHLQYISRDGHVELEDQDARVLIGDAALQDLFDEWRWGGWGMPEESRRRETFNLMLSMPAGTDRAAVREASRAFAREIFGDGRLYVFAQHDDEPHPHVHLCVRVRGPDGRCLNPRKRDLRTWREVFARQLREHGVDANATPRLARGETQRLPTQAVVRMQSRGVAPRFYRSVLDERAQMALWDAHIETLAVWRGVAQALAHSGIPEDRTMAMAIVNFVQHMPARQLEPGATRLDSATTCSHRAPPHEHRYIARFEGKQRSVDDRPPEPDPLFDRD
ncbi:plasmid-like protein [Burkholderia cenocepacia]|uniref:relaxase/mobilization nuclease domain-containing protein n=1 Tax=Burkholderia cenocepacia TaxID=95486 RepID=UPI0009B59895|nr:relaxase/mobilization nuclease domain-containing protein [Burkholderia cenocepacia]CAB5091367.1 plasmid-like protein [Burkholderia cenocepacia]CAB5103359.1 plasmid-like protein [Burkholderia cenocepacia]CAB5129425.1 plasmid-like protein [Burkholderia cenocepacia]CAB5140847.1 plasmid-like protein [Burkholderia cenocepacia]CAB5140884.1 plasmid-like protein [Burkholderia cenocepacia]